MRRRRRSRKTASAVTTCRCSGLGRPGGDRTVRGRGPGGALLLRADDRCIHVANDVGGVALLIDAKNDRAAHWYESYGVLALDDAPLSLVLPLATATYARKIGQYLRQSSETLAVLVA
jgi:hypothetical protein